MTDVQATIETKVPGVKLHNDCIGDLTILQVGNLSDGISIEISAKPGSKLIKEDTKTSVHISFLIKNKVKVS